MNKNRIIQLINNPDFLNVSDENHIQWELEKYPFVQSFHYLHLKWKLRFLMKEPIRDIEKLSVYSTHRELIKELIDYTRKSLELEKQEENKEIKQEEALNLIVTDENLKKETGSNRVEGETNMITDEMKIELVHDKLQDTEEKTTNVIVEEKSVKLELGENSKKDQKNINKLGLSYLFSSKNDEKESYSEQIAEKLEEEINPLDSLQKIDSNKPENNIVSEKENVSVQEIKEDKKKSEQENNLVNNVAVPKEKLTFNQWLSFSKTISDNKEDKKTDTFRKSQKNIIEEFIENTPKITPPKKGGKSRQEIDFKKEEIKDIANLMTVTLAQLYIEQGRYDTAIAAYKILSLKYPEKSSYFALEIKKIKKLKNSK